MENSIYKTLGNRIRAARESVGLSQEQLARQMGYTSPATVSHFESGARKISIADLHKLSSALGVPLEYFLIENEDTQMQRFRLRAEAIRPSERETVASFLAFAAQNGREPQRLPQSVRTAGAGEAALYVLQHLTIQKPPVSPFEIADQLNIPVFQWDFPSELSGIFVLDNKKACIGVNQHHPYVRQRFTVAHELGHFVFHDAKDLFVDFLDMDVVVTTMDDEDRSLEMKANWFAADLLMPRQWMYDDFERYGEKNLHMVAQKYEVSEQALWVRWVSLKLVGTSRKY